MSNFANLPGFTAQLSRDNFTCGFEEEIKYFRVDMAFFLTKEVHPADTYTGLGSMRRLRESITTPPLDRMLVHRRVTLSSMTTKPITNFRPREQHGDRITPTWRPYYTNTATVLRPHGDSIRPTL